MKRLLFALLGAISVSACAQPPAPVATASANAARATSATPAARARAVIRAVNPSVQIDQVGDAPMPGFQEVLVGGQTLYVSNDGKYMLQGMLYDVAARKNLGEASMAKLRRSLLQSIPESDRIIFAPANPKYTVTVFTDVECGYCRKMHSQIAEYNRLGIAVEYVAYPRGGLASAGFKKMVAVWCATDPKQALTDAKLDRPVAYRNCRNPVAMQYNLGRRAGLTGTPMVLTSDGTELGGYLPPDVLRKALDKLAADGAVAAAGKAAGAP